MAKANMCDRCGAFYTENTRYPKAVTLCKTVVDGLCFTTRNGYSVDYIDLCDDCITKLKVFLDGAELKEENV